VLIEDASRVLCNSCKRIRRRSADLGAALLQQLPQDGTVTARLVVAVAADGEVPAGLVVVGSMDGNVYALH
jgi:hypothetical protein